VGLIKKLVRISIVLILVLAVAGAFSINYIFDKMIGNQILNQLELDILQNYAIEDNIDSDSEKDVKEDNKDKGNGADSSIDEKSEESKEFTVDKLKELQENFSTMDKLKVMSMLTSKLSMDEIKDLTKLASGGVDEEELNRIKKNLKEKLSSKDIEYLKNIYEKYNQ